MQGLKKSSILKYQPKGSATEREKHNQQNTTSWSLPYSQCAHGRKLRERSWQDTRSSGRMDLSPTMLEMMLPCESMTPFGFPVVPDV